MSLLVRCPCLVNGSPIREFQMRKGLRQEDPLALFLFTVVAEGPSGLMKSAKENGCLFKGCLVGSEMVEVNLLQFTNDSIFLGEATLQNVLTIKSILRCLEMTLD